MLRRWCRAALWPLRRPADDTIMPLATHLSDGEAFPTNAPVGRPLWEIQAEPRNENDDDVVRNVEADETVYACRELGESLDVIVQELAQPLAATMPAPFLMGRRRLRARRRLAPKSRGPAETSSTATCTTMATIRAHDRSLRSNGAVGHDDGHVATDSGDETGVVDLLGSVLPLELLTFIYGMVHHDELVMAAALVRAGRPWPFDHTPGITRLLALSRVHHMAVVSALHDRHAWPDSSYGPGAAVWVSGIACSPPNAVPFSLLSYTFECSSLRGDQEGKDGEADGDDGPWRAPARTERTQPEFRLHPVLWNREWHAACFGAALGLPVCWIGTPACALIEAADANVFYAPTHEDAAAARTHAAQMRVLLQQPGWSTPALVLAVQVPHMCDFAHRQEAGREGTSPLMLTRTYFCPPGSALAGRFSVGAVVDAVADFYTGSLLTVAEMQRIKAHARSVWRSYERYNYRAWEPLLDAHASDDDDDDDAENRAGGDPTEDERRAAETIAMIARDPFRTYPDRDPRVEAAFERRFESWFSDRWLGEGGLAPSARRLTRQFRDPDRYGRPRLTDLAAPPTHEDPAPQLVVRRFRYGARRDGIRQLCVFFGKPASDTSMSAADAAIALGALANTLPLVVAPYLPPLIDDDYDNVGENGRDDMLDDDVYVIRPHDIQDDEHDERRTRPPIATEEGAQRTADEDGAHDDIDSLDDAYSDDDDDDDDDFYGFLI